MSKFERNEATATLYLQALVALKNWKLKLVVMNRHRTKGKYVADFSFIFKDTTGQTHYDSGIKLYNADYLFYLLDIQKHFPSAELLDLTADKDNPLKKCVQPTVIKVDTAGNERSENDLQTTTET